MGKTLEDIAKYAKDKFYEARIKKYDFDIKSYRILFDDQTVDFLKKRARQEYRNIEGGELRESLKESFPYLAPQKRK